MEAWEGPHIISRREPPLRPGRPHALAMFFSCAFIGDAALGESDAYSVLADDANAHRVYVGYSSSNPRERGAARRTLRVGRQPRADAGLAEVAPAAAIAPSCQLRS